MNGQNGQDDGYLLDEIQTAGFMIGRATSQPALNAARLSYVHWAHYVLRPHHYPVEVSGCREPDSMATTLPDGSPRSNGWKGETGLTQAYPSPWSPWSMPLVVSVELSASPTMGSLTGTFAPSAMVTVASVSGTRRPTGERSRINGVDIARLVSAVLLAPVVCVGFFGMVLTGVPDPLTVIRYLTENSLGYVFARLDKRHNVPV